MTKIQRRLFDFIVSYREQYGYSPSLNEMANAMNVASITGVKKNLAALVRKEKVRITVGVHRSVMPTNNQ